MMKFLRYLLLAALLFTAAPALAADTPSSPVTLQILSVNDFHGALVENGKNPGAAKLAAYLRQAKADYPDSTVLVSAGDMFQGSPDSNLLHGKTVVEFMNALEFDAMTLGNHEFDWGIPILRERIAQSVFPYISANVLDKASGQLADFVKPYIILERSGVKIGIIGITTPETAYKTSGKVVSAFTFADPAAVVTQLVPRLTAEGADVIVVLAHISSYMDTNHTITGEAAALASSAPGLSGIISGHSHQLVAGQVNGIPIVQGHYWGRGAGRLTIVYDPAKRQVLSAEASAVALQPQLLIPAADIAALVAASSQEIAPLKNIRLGEAATDLSHNRDLRQVSLLGQWTTDVMRQAAGTDIAFQNAGGIRTSIAAGPVTVGTLYEVFPFDNTLVTLKMTGQQIRQVIEYGITNTNAGMIQFSGLKVRYDAQESADRRLVITLPSGQALQDTALYTVATNDFLAAGGDNFTVFTAAAQITDTNLPLRDIIVAALKRLPVIKTSDDQRFFYRPATAILKPAA